MKTRAGNPPLFFKKRNKTFKKRKNVAKKQINVAKNHTKCEANETKRKENIVATSTKALVANGKLEYTHARRTSETKV